MTSPLLRPINNIHLFCAASLKQRRRIAETRRLNYNVPRLLRYSTAIRYVTWRSYRWLQTNILVTNLSPTSLIKHQNRQSIWSVTNLIPDSRHSIVSVHSESLGPSFARLHAVPVWSCFYSDISWTLYDACRCEARMCHSCVALFKFVVDWNMIYPAYSLNCKYDPTTVSSNCSLQSFYM